MPAFFNGPACLRSTAMMPCGPSIARPSECVFAVTWAGSGLGKPAFFHRPFTTSPTVTSFPESPSFFCTFLNDLPKFSAARASTVVEPRARLLSAGDAVCPAPVAILTTQLMPCSSVLMAPSSAWPSHLRNRYGAPPLSPSICTSSSW